MNRIVTVQDLSCLGRCSLTLALPVISAMGVECAVLPTALLSTHTGYPGNTYLDLTREAAKIAAHWQSLGIQAEGVYTGYLAGEAQCRLAMDVIRQFPGAKVLVDPAMGDHGRLYRGLGPEQPQAMGALCGLADIITPNVTEAALLTGLPYTPRPTPDQCNRLLDGLLALGAKDAVITGVPRGAETGFVGRGFSWFGPRQPWDCHGAGDLFAAVLAGGVMRGLALCPAAALGAWFVGLCLAGGPFTAGGIAFEPHLPELARRLADQLA